MLNYGILKPNELKEAEKPLVKADQFEFHLTDLSDNNSKFECKTWWRRNFSPWRTFKIRSRKHPLSKLIILNIHESNKHSSEKYTMNEFGQKFWLLCGRRIVRNITTACVTCHKRPCKSYRYPPSPPLTLLRLNDLRPLFTVIIDNLRPVFVRNIYFVVNATMNKAWVALYTCAASRAICLDLVPNMNSASFIWSFKWFISRYGWR